MAQHERRDNFALFADVPSTLVAGTPGGRKPAVSIVIPTYRRPEMLAEAVESALAQRGFDDYEVIVLDNDEAGSAETEAVVRRFASPRLAYYRNEKNLGMTGNWNRGIELARADWITLLHDDDWLARGFLARMWAARPADASFLACQAPSGDLGYQAEWPEPQGAPRVIRIDPSVLIGGNISPAPGVLFTRAAALRLGGYDDRFYPCADYDLYIRLVMEGGAYYVKEPLAYYRTVDSTTYKADTLSRMIGTSRTMKRSLMGEYPGVRSRIFYVDAMQSWYSRAAEHRVELAAGPAPDWLERAALGVSRRPLLQSGLSLLTRAARRLSPARNFAPRGGG